MIYIQSTKVQTSQELFNVFAQNNVLVIATEYFRSISQLLAEYKNRDDYHIEIRNELDRICNLIIE